MTNQSNQYNPFLTAARNALNRNGMLGTYIAVTEGVYNVETGSVTNTEKSYSIRMFKKHLKATQYNYPNLIGKDAGMFYIANDSLAFVPNHQDKIVFNGSTYSIDSIQEHYARNELVLYRIVAVRG